MTQDFAKIRPEPLLETKPAQAPPAWSLMVTGVVLGITLGVFACFLLYMSGNVPPLNGAIVAQQAENPVIGRQAIEEVPVEEELQLEFYTELADYEVTVDATPVDIDEESAAQNESTSDSEEDQPLAASILLQTGAFTQQNLANTEMLRLKSLGLSVMVKRQDLVGSTMFLVQAGPYDTRDQLSAAERVLRSNNISPMRLSLN